jgi:hypothetical protein
METLSLQALKALATRQHSLFTVQQAAAIGVSQSALRAASGKGWLRLVRRRVYAFTGHPPSTWEPLMAAVLAAGPDAVVSHRSAAAIHGIYGVVPDQPELTIPHNRRVHLDGVRIHRSHDLDRVDICHRSRVAVTTPIRTVIDLAAVIADPLLGRILDEGAISRLWTAERIDDRLLQLGVSGRCGAARLRRLLADRMAEGNPDSQLAHHVVRVLKPMTPPFEVNYVVEIGGEMFEMDLAWPQFCIDGEVDGMEVRALSRTKFERDRHRANVLAAHSWRLIHFTSSMDDEDLVAQIAPLLPPGAIYRRT